MPSLLLWPFRKMWRHQVPIVVLGSIGAVWFAAWSRSIDTSTMGAHYSLPALPELKSLASHQPHRADQFLRDTPRELADTSDSGG